MPLHRVLSLLTPDQMHALGGIPVEAIVGAVDGEELSVETFRQNPAFIAFLHDVIRRHGPNDTYCAFTVNGLIRLPLGLYHAYVDALPKVSDTPT